MKIQCNVCEVAEATVLCCADEAALCSACDSKIHAANKLASKHPRVPLANSSGQMPMCDICQDSIGYFFCLEDRALLCRKCDIAIHNANQYVSSHRRFLLTGVRVGPEEPVSSSSVDKVSDTETRSVSQIAAPMTGQSDKPGPARSSLGNLTPTKRSAPAPFVGEYPKEFPAEGGDVVDFTRPRLSYASGSGSGSGSGSAAGSLSQWHMDDILGLNEFNQNFTYADHGSSKDDSGKLGDSDSSSMLRTPEDDLDIEERMGQVPDIGRSGFKIPSPPTASHLFWPKSSSQESASTAHSVPDICLPLGHSSLSRRMHY